MSRLQFNYEALVWFLSELIHIANDERRFHLLGECSLNLPDDALHDIKFVLLEMRADERVMKVAA